MKSPTPNSLNGRILKRLLPVIAAVLALMACLLNASRAYAADEPPQMSVNYTHNWVGMEADVDQDVTIVVEDKASISGSTGDNGRFYSHEWEWTPAHPEIGPGDTVTGTVGDTVMVIDPVGRITARADYEANTVTGQIDAPWISLETVTVRCEVWEEGDPPSIEVEDVDADGGTFECDFSAEGWDLQEDQTLAVFYIQPDNQRVNIVIEEPQITVNYGHDWVDVETDADVAVEVNVSDKATVTGMTDGSGSFTTRGATWSPEHPDIIPGDTVTVTVGGIVLGVVEVGVVNAGLDFDNDLVASTIDAPWLSPEPVNVRCDIWEDGGPDGIEVENVDPDGGAYACDFEALSWDLQPDQMIAVRYIQPDGHEVINTPEAPWVRVNYGHDWVGANYELGHSFRITVTDSADAVKAVATIDTEAGGGWGGDGFQTEWDDWQPDDPDIEPGDRVLFSADDGYENIIRVGDIGGTVDLDGDSVSGSIQAGWLTETLNVECHPWGGWPGPAETQNSTARPDGSDTYACGWSSVWDVQPGQDIAVFYELPGGRDLVGTVFFGTATRYVAATGSDDDNICADASAPCKTLQHAIDEAFDGEEILVAEGTYTENLRIDSQDTSVRGGHEISGTTWTPGAGETILQGVEDDDPVFEIDHCELSLENLTLTGGNGDEKGGGIWIHNDSEVELANLKIFGNEAQNGGGLAIEGDSTATIIDVDIYGNTADGGEGGGILAEVSQISLIRSRVVGNIAIDNDGGGIAIEESALRVENSIIAGNRSTEHAGGLWIFTEEPAIIVNSHIIGNETPGEGAAIAAKEASRIVMTNTLVISNTGNSGLADRDGDGSTFILSHCDTFGNSPDGADGTTVTRSDCLGSPAGDGVDPQMASGPLPMGVGPDYADAWMAYDFRLEAGSPAIDAGDNADAPSTDIDSVARPQDGDLDGSATADMGAYEFSPAQNFLPISFTE